MSELRRFLGAKGKGLFLLVASAVVLIGCQTAPLRTTGGTVPPSKRVLLEERGQHSGQYKTEDLEMRYQYLRSQFNLRISGSIHFADRLTNSFVRINNFHADVLLLDAQGKVVGTEPLITSAIHESEDPLDFERAMAIPPHTAGISFSYSGTAKPMDPKDVLGGGMYFSDYPTGG